MDYSRKFLNMDSLSILNKQYFVNNSPGLKEAPLLGQSVDRLYVRCAAGDPHGTGSQRPLALSTAKFRVALILFWRGLCYCRKGCLYMTNARA